MQRKILFVVFLSLTLTCIKAFSQETQIRGFVDVQSNYDGKKTGFSFGEQDLFITSKLNDRISFLGESVFKFSPASPTSFDVSIERIVLKYNIKGNHNLLVGKHHSPLNYWNDTYHHGRVFFPTIDRPLLFGAEIIPLHTTGLDLQGQNFGKLRFGYDLMVGNGIGSSDLGDNDKAKSITAAVHIKPADGLRFGLSYYYDAVSKGATVHGRVNKQKVNQYLVNPSISYFGKTVEFLTEATVAMNHTDSTGTANTVAAYTYAGAKVKDNLIPYVRFDFINYDKKEVYFMKNNIMSYVAGIRYEINYLAVVKLEYQHVDADVAGTINKLTAQFAIGF